MSELQHEDDITVFRAAVEAIDTKRRYTFAQIAPRWSKKLLTPDALTKDEIHIIGYKSSACVMGEAYKFNWDNNTCSACSTLSALFGVWGQLRARERTSAQLDDLFNLLQVAKLGVTDVAQLPQLITALEQHWNQAHV